MAARQLYLRFSEQRFCLILWWSFLDRRGENPHDIAQDVGCSLRTVAGLARFCAAALHCTVLQ